MCRPDIIKVREYLNTNNEVSFAYLFGSHARGDTGPLSDVDVAVYLHGETELFSRRLAIIQDIMKLLKDSPCDVVVLNNSPIVLQYEVIRENVILKENKECRVAFETKVLREYLDTEMMREVQRRALKKRFRRESNVGE